MNILPVSNYRNQASFGMAFKKPSKDVSKYFNEVLEPLTPNKRKEFVDAIEHHIQQAKKCPVDIEHTLLNEYSTHYGAKIGNEIYSYDPQKSTNRVNSILDVMDRAVKSAENRHDIITNQKRLNKILNG